MKRPEILRMGLAALVAFDLVALAIFLGDVDAPTSDGMTALVASLPCRLLLAIVGLVAIARFSRKQELASGAVALGVLALFSHAHAALVGSPWRHLYYSGLCLMGWLVGAAFARSAGRPDDETYARKVATALLGAAYASAGLSKLAYGGAAWLDGSTLRAIVVAQDGLVGEGVLPSLRHAVVDHPSFAAALAIATVLLELGGALFLLGPRTRAVVATGLLAMHVSIFALTGIPYVEAALLLVLFGLPIVPERTAPDLGPPARPAAIAAVVLATICAVSIVRASTTAVGPTGAHGEIHVEALGPFRVGAALGGATISRLGVAGDAVHILVERDGERAAFELTCRVTTDRSPFDRGDLHVFYRETTLPFASLRPIGQAIRDSMGSEGCPGLAAWIARRAR